MSDSISGSSSVKHHHQRKFVSAVSGKPGLARQAREAVAQAVRRSTIGPTINEQKRTNFVPPLDYEDFLKTAKEINENFNDFILFPVDDISETAQPQTIRTVRHTVTAAHFAEASNSLFSQECLKTYTADWRLANFNYARYGGDYKPLMNMCPNEELPEIQYEIDACNIDSSLLEDSESSKQMHSVERIVKEGYLLLIPQSMSSDNHFTFKPFKRRYCYLRKSIDGSHKLDFYKDRLKVAQPGTSAKATIYMDLCYAVAKASKKGKFYLELKLNSENAKLSAFLSAENERILDSWFQTLDSIVEDCQKMLSQKSKTADSTSVCSMDGAIITNGTKDEMIESLKPPDYSQFLRESSENAITRNKRSLRNLFSLYSGLEALPIHGELCTTVYANKITKPYSRKFGVRFLVECKHVSIKLSLSGSAETVQVEPIFLSLFLFDAKEGKRLSETFNCDINDPSLKKQLLYDCRFVENNVSSPDSVNSQPNFVFSAYKKALFSVNHPHADVYLVAHFEKLLQGNVQSGQEPYAKQDPKLAQKLQKSIPNVCCKLGQYKMPFAWSAKPVFQQFVGGTETAKDTIPLYRQDQTKLSDEELAKFLQETKLEKSAKLFIIPEAYVTINIDVTVKTEKLKNCLTSSYIPVAPYAESENQGPLVLEMESLPSHNDTAVDSEPFVEYVNLLYVYPTALKYDTQRSFSKARNLCCFVEFRDTDVVSSPPLKRLYGRHGFDASRFETRLGTAVSHHETCPQFYEQVKIDLPAGLNEKHHILFTFCHVSVEHALNGKNKKESVESCVGYAWLPLVKYGKLIADEEFFLPVSVFLPDGYLSFESLGLNKGYVGPELKWVENGKPLFKVSIRLYSTVLTRDQHLQTFFNCCQRLRDQGTLPDIISPENAKNNCTSPGHVSFLDPGNGMLSESLFNVDVRLLVAFLPTILNQIFNVLLLTSVDELSIGAMRALIHIVNEVHSANKTEVLRSYVKYVFYVDKHNGKTLHEEIIKFSTVLLCQYDPNDNKSPIPHYLRNLWWFLEVVVKSLCQFIFRNQLIDVPRTERFSMDWQCRIEAFVQALVAFMCQNYSECKEECTIACHSLAYFFRACLSLMDRGFSFKLIHFSLDKFGSFESKTLKEFIIEFLSVLCEHEHFVPLNLPILIMKNGESYSMVKNAMPKTNHSNAPAVTQIQSRGLFRRLLSLGVGMFALTNHINAMANPLSTDLSTSSVAEVAHELRLSEEYCKHHYLISVLIRMLQDNLNESKDLRARIIAMLRNLLAKLSFDNRYSQKIRSNLATLCFPFIPALIECVPYMEISKERTPSVSPGDTLENRSRSHDSSSRGAGLSDVLIAAGSLPRSETPVGSRPSISTCGDLPLVSSKHPSSSLPPYDTTSLETKHSDSVLSGGSDSTLRVSASFGQSSQQPQKLSSHGGPSNVSLALQVLPYGRFDEAEMRDLLICFLHIVKDVPDDILAYFWQQATEFELLSFLKLLELSLAVFKYHGKQRVMQIFSRNARASRKQLRFSYTREVVINADGINASGSLKESSLAGHESISTPTHPSQCSGTPVSVGVSGGRNSSFSIDTPFSVLQAKHLSQQVGTVVLNCLTAFASSQKGFLTQTQTGSNDFFKRVYAIYLSLLDKNSSAELIQQTLATLRIFVKIHIESFLTNSSDVCNILCRKLLELCNYSVTSIQMEACSFLYILMRLNFEHGGRKNFGHVHQQIVVALSQLLGDGLNLNNSTFNRGLAIINGFANTETCGSFLFAAELKEVVRRQRTILMATSQLKDCADNPDMMADLHKSLADGYARSPRLRETWLENLARHNKKYAFWTEAAQCYLHIIALIAAELNKSKKLENCYRLEDSIPAPILSVYTNDSKNNADACLYDEESLIVRVHEFAYCTIKAERYEDLSNLYKLIVPIYEKRKNYEALADIYGSLQSSYHKLALLSKTGRRFLGTYFRVILYNQIIFEQQHGVEYVYRENKVTTLSEVAERLKTSYASKFGSDNVKLITDPINVIVENLDPKLAYVQITHVDPYCDNIRQEDHETIGDYEKHSNIKSFVYEVPFTATEGQSRSQSVIDQCKRQIILQTAHPLPYVLRRVPVAARRVIELNPLQTALDELQTRTADLRKILRTVPVDLKYLQLLLQGSVLATVNAGPLKYAEAFCQKDQVEKYGLTQWDALKDAFKNFAGACSEALAVNETLIKPDQIEYHRSMVNNFRDMITILNDLFHDEMLPTAYHDDDDVDSMDSMDRQRCSVAVFNYISGIR